MARTANGIAITALTATTITGASAKTSPLVAQQHEPAGADDDRRHDQHEAGAGVGQRVRAAILCPPRRPVASARRAMTSDSDKRAGKQRRQRRRARRWSAWRAAPPPRRPVGQDRPRARRPPSPAIGPATNSSASTISATLNSVSRPCRPNEAARRDRQVGVAGRVGAEPHQHQHDDDGQHDLQQRQRHGARRDRNRSAAPGRSPPPASSPPARRRASARW